jgi:hypothetical protein
LSAQQPQQLSSSSLILSYTLCAVIDPAILGQISYRYAQAQRNGSWCTGMNIAPHCSSNSL